MSDRDRPKRSWREIDAVRDGGRRDAGARPSSAREATAQDKASRDHRAALDKLFAKGEVGKYAEKLGIGAKTATTTAPKAEPTPPPEPPKPSAAELERASLRKKILEGTSREAVARAFDRYAKLAGMPKDWELLERGLEHPRADRLADVLTEIEALLTREKPRRTRTLDGRLRFIAETHEETDLRARAEALRARLV
jgi:hypothetical protein